MTGPHLISNCAVLILYVTLFSKISIEGAIHTFRNNEQNCVVNGCICYTHYMECEDGIPMFIPSGITNVKLTDLNCNGLSPETFKNQTWGNILTLDISWQKTFENNFSIANDTFKRMNSLQTLGIHVRGCSVYQLEYGAFNGLDSIVEFNVSNNERFSFDVFSMILNSETAFPNLKKLLMNYFSIPNIMHVQINLNDSVLTALGRRNLTCLEANGNFINVLDLDPANIIFNYLENISLKSVEVHEGYSGNWTNDTNYRSLRKLDISESRVPVLMNGWKDLECKLVLENRHCKVQGKEPILLLKRLRHLETLIANNIYFGPDESLPPFNVTLSIHSKHFTFSLKTISLQRNTIKRILFEIETNITFVLQILDLQYNEIEYFGLPDLLDQKLSTLLLAHNNLHIMLKSHPDQFTEMFKHMRNLQVVDISSNKLSYVPKTMFENNVHLQEIYLSDNNLMQFYQTVVIPCRVIDLANNNIDAFNKTSIRWFEEINDKSNGSLQLHIDSNPLQCRCNSRTFVNWVLTSEFVFNQNLICRLEGVQMQLNKATYAKLENDCNVYIKYIIISSIAFATLCVAVMFAKLGKQMLNRRKTKRNAGSVLSKLKNGCFKLRFLSFLIYSDNDSEIVLEYLWHLLTDTFKTNVGDVEGESLKFVGIGDRHFRPGYGIMDEVNKCFNDTAVILAVVSNAFCESVFCKNELEYAIILNKPVVLFFVEKIPEESMPACVRQLFNKNVRVKIEMKDAEIKVTPHVDDVCSAIFSLAY